uniref:Uncharacterized protein n=1 Tax=Chromera velia CCMP2878 TaxID=1169474 RepID=A0A0G4GI62_9ALVE|eukprot:Cvel_4738.t1-p1 / transcript=Cvel_4738.t1 / gene=Cvel_4738 / organism=Chromera_velia_CCMP2878 / gene_product=Formin-like protein 20, putative / transcript_product=Formin-like protein 20, putative / location=Cvel_scaffold211:15472-16497(-) / protein_length=342 / sequence_SO=supercontig / SO=protein_coding / is_pseudo=false
MKATRAPYPWRCQLLLCRPPQVSEKSEEEDEGNSRPASLALPIVALPPPPVSEKSEEEDEGNSRPASLALPIVALPPPPVSEKSEEEDEGNSRPASLALPIVALPPPPVSEKSEEEDEGNSRPASLALPIVALPPPPVSEKSEEEDEGNSRPASLALPIVALPPPSVSEKSEEEDEECTSRPVSLAIAPSESDFPAYHASEEVDGSNRACSVASSDYSPKKHIGDHSGHWGGLHSMAERSTALPSDGKRLSVVSLPTRPLELSQELSLHESNMMGGDWCVLDAKPAPTKKKKKSLRPRSVKVHRPDIDSVLPPRTSPPGVGAPYLRTAFRGCRVTRSCGVMV